MAITVTGTRPGSVCADTTTEGRERVFALQRDATDLRWPVPPRASPPGAPHRIVLLHVHGLRHARPVAGGAGVTHAHHEHVGRVVALDDVGTRGGVRGGVRGDRRDAAPNVSEPGVRVDSVRIVMKRTAGSMCRRGALLHSPLRIRRRGGNGARSRLGAGLGARARRWRRAAGAGRVGRRGAHGDGGRACEGRGGNGTDDADVVSEHTATNDDARGMRSNPPHCTPPQTDNGRQRRPTGGRDARRG